MIVLPRAVTTVPPRSALACVYSSRHGQYRSRSTNQPTDRAPPERSDRFPDQSIRSRSASEAPTGQCDVRSKACVKPSASRSSMCSPARASSTVRRRRSWRRCSTKAITCARSGRCIASWPPISRSESGAISASIPSTPSPSWWPRRRTRPGPGTSPSCWGRPSGRTSTSMSCSTSSAATRSAGWSQTGRTRRWPVVSSKRPATNRASSPRCSPCTPTAARR